MRTSAEIKTKQKSVFRADTIVFVYSNTTAFYFLENSVFSVWRRKFYLLQLTALCPVFPHMKHFPGSFFTAVHI